MNQKTINTMHYMSLNKILLLSAGFLAAASLAPAEEKKPEAAKPKVSVAEFTAKITRDTAEIKNAGQIVMSYADVVQRILPSVVSINSYSKKPQRMGGMGGMNEDEMLQQMPPQLRKFFEEFMQKQGGGQGKRQQQDQPQRPQKPQQTGLGSGVILTDDGYILTNNHVVAGADELKVSLAGKSSKEYTAKVIGADPSSDVALIKIEASGLPHATFGDSSKSRVGDVVLAVGAPMGLKGSVSQGIVSALGRSDMGIYANKTSAGYEDFIQTDAAINPGNSGGPLVDAQGRVIGINSVIETRTGMFAGIGLAIPINMALNNVTDLLDHGTVHRGFLGVEMGPVEPSMADFLGLTDGGGVTVIGVMDNSPASKAGFEGGDVIVSADGEKVSETSKLRLMISSKHPGTEVKFGVVRFNEKSKKPDAVELVAKLEILPDNLMARSKESGIGKGDKKSGEIIKGVKVNNLTDELRQEYSIADDVEGVVVTSVDEKSAAAKAGLEEGDVISRINRQTIKTLSEAREQVGDAGGAILLRIFREGRPKDIVVK